MQKGSRFSWIYSLMRCGVREGGASLAPQRAWLWKCPYVMALWREGSTSRPALQREGEASQPSPGSPAGPEELSVQGQAGSSQTVLWVEHQGPKAGDSSSGNHCVTPGYSRTFSPSSGKARSRDTGAGLLAQSCPPCRDTQKREQELSGCRAARDSGRDCLDSGAVGRTLLAEDSAARGPGPRCDLFLPGVQFLHAPLDPRHLGVSTELLALPGGESVGGRTGHPSGPG